MFLRIIVEHEGCWSKILRNYNNIYGELLSQKVKTKRQIEGYVRLVQEGRYSDKVWDKFFAELRKDKSIIELNKIESMENGRVYVVKTIATTHKAMSVIVDKLDVPYYREIFINGYEIWYMYLFYDVVDQLINMIKERATLIKLEKIDWQKSNFDLALYNEKDLKIFKFAFDNGYYDNPKSHKLNELAQIYGISKSNMAKKLRTAHKNAISIYLKSFLELYEVSSL